MTIYEEIDVHWSRVRQQMGDTAPQGYVDARLLIADAEADVENVIDKLQPWLAMSELAIATLASLYQLALAVRAGTSHSTAFVFQIGRACSYAVAMRKLILAGQEDPARVLFRSYIENLDIAIVALDDASLAERMGINADLDDRVWREEVARGRIHKRAAQVAERAGLRDPDWHARRRNDHSILSTSVHSSATSAFRSSAVFSLMHEGAIVLTPMGHPSDTSPHLLHRLAEEAYETGAVILKLVMHDEPPPLFRDCGSVHSNSLAQAFSSFMLLQEVFTAHRGEIAEYERKRRERLNLGADEPEG